MALACRPPDERLLMLIHRQLTPAMKAMTLAHLAFCPECRKRKDELTRATQLLAGFVREPGMPAWRPHSPLFQGSKSWVVSGSIIALLIFGSLWFGARSMAVDNSGAQRNPPSLVIPITRHPVAAPMHKCSTNVAKSATAVPGNSVAVPDKPAVASAAKCGDKPGNTADATPN